MQVATEPLYIVHTEASGGWGGQEIRILTEAQGMIARGHHVEIWAVAGSQILQEAARRRIPHQALPLGRKRLRGVKALRAALKAAQPDVVNTHSSTDAWIVALARLLWREAPPVVRTRHISSPISRGWATRWLYTRATCHIVTTGERLRETLIRENGYRVDRVVSVPTGVDTKRFAPGDSRVARMQLGLDPEAPTVGIVATLRSWKGHQYLIDAIAALPSSINLVIVGDGPQRSAIERQIVDRGIAERVLLAGNQRDVVPWLQAIDIFVLPSYANEGVPQSVVQAMLCGLPVISTQGVGAIDEAVRHEETGLLVPARDSAAIAAAIARLLDDPLSRRQMGVRARAIAERAFGLDVMLDRMESLFRRVAGMPMKG
jgi:glycosyltransferase involved in cell wall biosynthesis